MTVARPYPLVVLAWLCLVASCYKSPRVEFPRPPASASIPEPEKATESDPELTPPAEPDPPPPDPPSPEHPSGRLPGRETPAPPPAPDTPPSRASRSTPAKEDPAAIQEKVRRTESLLESVSGRSLSQQEREQVVSARTFIIQAKDALAAGEPKRAAVLADKGYILAQDVERSSR